MPLKSEILKELETNRDRNLSGQFLADKFGVSRNAVWKIIKVLKEEGYKVQSVTNKGYRLEDECDLLSAEGIVGCLSNDNRKLPVYFYKVIDSTNSEAKRLLAGGLNQSALIVAESQTAGRGRLGRTFYSPEHTGIYMTLVIHPKVSFFDAVSVTTAASVAVVRAVERLTKIKVGIKWINDIYLHNKKVCGILTEAVTDVETGTIQSILIGIGINIHTADFPKELADVAVSLNPDGVTRNRLTAAIVQELLDITKNWEDKSYLKEYREHSLVLGQSITYSRNGIAFQARAMAVDDAGGLVIQNEQGETEVLRSGEISVRLNS